MKGLIRIVSMASLLLATSACATFEVREADLLNPDDPPKAAGLPDGYEVEQFVVRGPERSIGVTYAHRPGNRVFVQYCGGNEFRRSRDGGGILRQLARGADVVLFDYPGYGDSTGEPAVATILEDAHAVYDHFIDRGAATGKARIVYGFSLGSFVASALASDRDPDVLVLEGTAPNVKAWASEMVPLVAKPFVRISVADELASLDNVGELRNVRSRMYILGGGKDKRTPPALGRSMAAALAGARADVQFKLFPAAAHGGIMATPEFPGFWDGLVQAASRAAPARP
jgi:pimeloyl-ACP methyl ester carboxylesterase